MSLDDKENRPVEVSLDINSGEIVFDDWLGKLFEIEEEHYLNVRAGIKNRILDYGKNQLFHGYVGNSCPSIVKKGNKIYIGNFDDSFGGEVIGGIITDLWWYSLADRDLFLKKGGSKSQEYFNVDPGKYLLKHYLEPQKVDGGTLYAILEKTDQEAVLWDLPEETLEKNLLRELPQRFKGEDSFFRIYPHYEKIGKGYEPEDYQWVGYECFFHTEKCLEKVILTHKDLQEGIDISLNKILKIEEIGEQLDKLMKKMKDESLSEEEKLEDFKNFRELMDKKDKI